MQDVWIDSGALRARITDFGASLVDLRLRGVAHALVLGYPKLQDHVQDGQLMGAVVGRYANRISGGYVPWDGAALALEKNEAGTAHLHGGSTGSAQQNWQILAASDTSVSLQWHSPEGASGYPGAFTATAIYEVQDTVLRLKLLAQSTHNTLCNLCHHPYFSLDGKLQATTHSLRITADRYLPTDAALIPTGDQASVQGTTFDFRTEKRLPDVAFNNTYCVHNQQVGALQNVAILSAADIRMAVHSTQPGVHLYSGYKLKPTAFGHHGSPYAAGAGVCLEAQAWPDSPNNPTFPPVRLKAGDTVQQITEYRFSRF